MGDETQAGEPAACADAVEEAKPALAVFLEVKAAAGDYRDVVDRRSTVPRAAGRMTFTVWAAFC